jgi:hypothetical protein
MQQLLSRMRIDLARRRTREATRAPRHGAADAPGIARGFFGPLRGRWPVIVTAMAVAVAEALLVDFVFARVAPLVGIAAGTRPLAYPSVAVTFVAAMLYGSTMAVAAGIASGVATAIFGGFDLGVFLVSLCATFVVARRAPRITRRSMMAQIAVGAGMLQLPFLVLMVWRRVASGADVVDATTGLVLFYATLAISTLVCAMILLPLAEKVTRRLSTASVARYTDLETPLLRRLCLEAPGTYHHSMMVGDLAQAAAEAIGASGVIARAGAYYHDIGKLAHPSFYMENQTGAVNPHDALPPNISRIILVNHVKEGLALARLNALPRVLTRFIATHHGTGIARWFLVKERERLAAKGDGAERAYRPEDYFRDPGPLPVTKEETIVSLADSVEATSRSMRFFDKAKIEEAVRGIVADRWSDGQLAESEVTGAELETIRNSFEETLVHLLHGRLPYPTAK